MTETKKPIARSSSPVDELVEYPEIPTDYVPTEQVKKWAKLFIEFNEKLKPEDATRGYEKVMAYIADKITWAEAEGMPPKLLGDLTEYAYLQLNAARYEAAEKLFRGLSMLDHKNPYYHVALGVTYQRQQRFKDALVDYTIALTLNEKDVVALTNRAEVYFQLGENSLSLADLNQAIALDTTGRDPWANRAKLLRKQVLDQIKLDAEEDAASAGDEGKDKV